MSRQWSAPFSFRLGWWGLSTHRSHPGSGEGTGGQSYLQLSPFCLSPTASPRRAHPEEAEGVEWSPASVSAVLG